MAIVTNGRLEYEMSAIDVTYPDIGKVTYRGSYPLIVSNQWRPEKPPEEYTDCITFTGESSDFTLKATNKKWNGILEYSTDHNTWTTLSGTEEMQSVDKKLYLRGSRNTIFFNGTGINFVLSARASCSGNIQTLLEYSNPPTSIPTNWCYSEMFLDCKNLTAAPELPATTLTNCCYLGMFQNCTSLKISATQSTKYPTAWRIPSSGTISSTPSSWNASMLFGTGGTFIGDPDVNTTYYGAW